MITRVVKMKFKNSGVAEFKEIFNESAPKIRVFAGCHGVNLFCACDDPTTLFTISTWESPEALELYRNSALFKGTWSRTKRLFEEKAQAWSLDQIS